MPAFSAIQVSVLIFSKEAARREEKYKAMAMEDEDLEAVREALQQMGWGIKLV